MRRSPFRVNNEITQNYGDGKVCIYSIEDIAPPGLQPQLKRTKKFDLFYSEQRLGVTRLYLSRQHNAEIERVIRVQRLDIRVQDIAVTEDGKTYVIDTVQSVADSFPPSLDLALRRTEMVEEVLPGE